MDWQMSRIRIQKSKTTEVNVMKVRMKGLASAVLTLVFMLACTLCVFADTAVITTSDGGSVNMREEPSTDADVVDFLEDGTEVEVLGTDGDWTQVSYDGRTGYVMSSLLEVTETDTDTAAEDTSSDTAADTTEEETDTVDTVIGEDTEEDTIEESDTEEETAVEEEEEDSDSEKLAQYKKLVMILGLVCLVLVIIIINLLLFYRRGYDDYDDEDDEDEDDEEEEERPHRGRRVKTAEPQYEPIKAPQDTREIETESIGRMVEESEYQTQSQTQTPIRQQTSDTSDDDDDLEFFDLDDL